MGDEVTPDALVDARTYRHRLTGCLAALGEMLENHERSPLFDASPPRAGLELELVLTDAEGSPAMVNDAALTAIDDDAFVAEIGRWTLEYNSEPMTLAGDGLARMEATVTERLAHARQRCASVDGTPDVVMVGVLPTLDASHLVPASLTDSPRYRHLDAAVHAARGEDADVVVTGREELRTTTATVALEGACTSAQLHLAVTPERFAATYAAAQLIAGAQVALAANSPFFAGAHLWEESRIPLFTQAVDTRPVELRRQGVLPRVLFGDRWVDSALDLYTQDVELFTPLIPEMSEQDPRATLDAGAVPALAELRMHTSTIWRWNRAVYDVVDGVPHLRVENRVLPAGPTPVDVMANAALFYGAVTEIAAAGPDPRQVDATTVADDFARCAREGLAATLSWPGAGRLGVVEVVTDHLLPAARRGLARLGVDEATAQRYLDVLDQRARTGRTGADWQARATAALERGSDRPRALAAMITAYAERSRTGEPVHTWTLPA